MIRSVGYGHPPEHSRFPKGQSGNPRGRPRKAPSDPSLAEQPVLTTTLQLAERKVSRRENGKIEKISTREALIQAALLAALKGNPRALALALGLLREADNAQAYEIRERNALWERYIECASAELAEAAKQGLPPPKTLPHPDDVVIDQLKGPRFLGPIDEEDQAKLEKLLRFRDVLVMQEALDQRSPKRLEGTPMTDPGSALLLAMSIDRLAPQRLRLSDADWIDRISQHMGMPKRQLLKRLYAAWHDLGHPLPRGYVMPSHSRTRARLALIYDLARETLAGRLDPDAMARGEWDEAAQEVFARHGCEVSSLVP